MGEKQIVKILMITAIKVRMSITRRNIHIILYGCTYVRTS